MAPSFSDDPISGSPRYGVWLIGARGSVATTAIAGAAALRHRLVADTGLITRAPGFPQGPLPEVDALVFGGHEYGEGTGTHLLKRAEHLARAGVLPPDLPQAVRDDLRDADRAIVDGVAPSHGEEHPADGLRRLRHDLTRFAVERRLDTVVVINLASTEPPTADRLEYASLDALTAAVTSGAHVLPTSARYAHAAFSAGFGYVNFTPSVGAGIPALAQLADQNRVPYAGNDGKTGETLLKSVLAPMFASRNLHVRSWAGTNLLGGGDGATLADPATAASKLTTKSRLVSGLLGYPVDAPLHIDHVADLGERKTAWDHISFTGFLGAPMTLQFTWQGLDSALAAPLVLDLARLMIAAQIHGRHGPVPELAYFFKDPIETTVQDLATQHTMVHRFTERLTAGTERLP